jgi:hypothetical protein
MFKHLGNPTVGLATVHLLVRDMIVYRRSEMPPQIYKTTRRHVPPPPHTVLDLLPFPPSGAHGFQEASPAKSHFNLFYCSPPYAVPIENFSLSRVDLPSRKHLQPRLPLQSLLLFPSVRRSNRELLTVACRSPLQEVSPAKAPASISSTVPLHVFPSVRRLNRELSLCRVDLPSRNHLQPRLPLQFLLLFPSMSSPPYAVPIENSHCRVRISPQGVSLPLPLAALLVSPVIRQRLFQARRPQ